MPEFSLWTLIQIRMNKEEDRSMWALLHLALLVFFGVLFRTRKRAALLFLTN
jgi:hypothetical protein